MTSARIRGILENKQIKLVWDFDIKTEHHIRSKKKTDLKVINKQKKTCQIVDVTFLAGHRKENKTKPKIGKILGAGKSVGY